MDWTQFFTLMGTMIGGIFAFYQMTRHEIAVIREQINTMNIQHREDIKCMDDKWLRIDEKWERLFEKLLMNKQ